MNNKIILIGGASGTSKTTSSRDISSKFDIAHRLGSGFIREMAKFFISKNENPSLYKYSFSPVDGLTPFQNLYRQSQAIEPMINLAVKRASSEGTSIIIEGVNIIPGLNEYKESTNQIILYVEDEAVHYRMIHGPTHKKRRISKENFKSVRLIQSEFIKRAQDFEWSLFDISKIENLEDLLKNKDHL